MIKKISTMVASLAVVALFWYFMGEVYVLKNNDNSVSKLQCVSYAPFTKDQSPYMFEDGMIISEEQVRKDLQLLAQYTTCIRTYSTVGLEMIPKVARETGLKMLMGAWVSANKDDTRLELDALIRLANAYPDVVNAVIVGNEVLLRGDTNAKVLREHIEYVKNGLPNTQVTYADVWEFWVKNQEIREVTDFVTIHILPYWEDDPMNIEQSIGHLADVRGEVEAILNDKNILIGETGWPSEGRMREDALPSKINQAKFIRDFVHLAEKNNWNYNIIEAFDQSWKRNNEGAVGGFWGLFDKDRGDKFVLAGNVSNFPNYQFLALGSLALILIFSLIVKNINLGMKKLVLFGSVNTLFAILFMLQIEQYTITVRNSMELIWALVVLGTHLGIYFFVLQHIASDKKMNILNISTILKQKIFSNDALVMIFFYISFLCVVIASLALAFEGRYRNFEIYVFIISAVSFLWLFRGKYTLLGFGIFEKMSAFILLISAGFIFENETYLNTFSNIWIAIALLFTAILYLGSQQIAFSKLKSLIGLIILFSAFFASIRYGITYNVTLAKVCSKDDSSLMCVLRTEIGYYAYLQIFGYLALVSSIVAYIARTQWLSVLALLVSIGALILMNSFLGAFAFMLSLFLLSKTKN
ncbi:MAG: glycosyl hydrolase family 17 protein [Arcobacteraceae bacterium]